MKLAVFDFDSTLMDGETLEFLAKELGIDKEVREITDLAMRGEIDIFESFQKSHKLVEFHSSKRKKSACLFSEADALLVLFSFYFISRISSSFTSSVGLPPASSLFRKANIAAVSSRRSSARSTTTRSLFLRPNMATPQQ